MRRNLANACILFLVAVPPICVIYILRHFCVLSGHNVLPCAAYVHHPIFLLNLLWLIHVDVTFYIISLVQGSTWLIDPYWTLAPPLLVVYWLTHPRAAHSTPRQAVAAVLLFVWSARLTHSYFRREGWAVGAREDFRYADMRRRFGKWWNLVQVGAVYAVQHAMIVGLTLPWQPIAFSRAPWTRYDSAAVLFATLGLLAAAHADAALHAFTAAASRPDGTTRVLRTGLWAVSRHPNHFGEQVWWWSLWLFSIPAAGAWTVLGAAFNTLCMVEIMKLVEARMLSVEARREEYEEYQAAVSMCIPWPPRGPVPRAALKAATRPENRVQRVGLRGGR